MEAGILKLENDVEKAHFQQELNKWFESRGIIADLRSHLRHLMILALQSAQIGSKPTDKSSPKTQALNLIVAEYLYRHGCHYSLSVFTSEVPTLANFHPEIVLQNGKPSVESKNRSEGKCFQDHEVEEIFSALGMSSPEGELALLKSKYSDKGNDFSLIELFLQAIVEMSTKLLIRQNLKSCGAKEERLLSKEWSSRIANILLNEKVASPQIIALEEAIFRTTENEIRRIMEEERRLHMKSLSQRERRIQEYLKKHEDEILLRLIKAEKDLAMQKDIIVGQMSDREKQLTKMVMEWRNKHEEILKLSKNFHNIENENKDLQNKLKAFEEENLSLKTQGKTQAKTIDDLREEINSLINKLKEVTASNISLSERIQVLISRENKEVLIHQDNANQKTSATSSKEIPLLWSKNKTSTFDIDPVDRENKNSESELKSKEFTAKNLAPPHSAPHPDEWNSTDTEKSRTHLGSGDLEQNKIVFNINPSEDEDENVSLSSSSEDIILSVRKRLQDLEEETSRINHSYLEYKSKCVCIESNSESSSSSSTKSPPNNIDETVIKETKFCQTRVKDIFSKIQKLNELRDRKIYVDDFVTKKSEKLLPTKSITRAPTKRQLHHRDFFLKSRQLLQRLEKQNVEHLDTSPSCMKSHESSSNEELAENSNKKFNSKPSTKSNSSSSLSTVSVRSGHESDAEKPKKPQTESTKNASSMESSNNALKADLSYLALLETTRIKSPKISEIRSLRQQVLLLKPEKELKNNEGTTKNCSESCADSSEPISQGKIYSDNNDGSHGFL